MMSYDCFTSLVFLGMVSGDGHCLGRRKCDNLSLFRDRLERARSDMPTSTFAIVSCYDYTILLLTALYRCYDYTISLL